MHGDFKLRPTESSEDKLNQRKIYPRVVSSFTTDNKMCSTRRILKFSLQQCRIEVLSGLWRTRVLFLWTPKSFLDGNNKTWRFNDSYISCVLLVLAVLNLICDGFFCIV